MNAHISDELPRLLTGDATRGETLSAAEHLRGCPDCQQELVSAVIAHASLTSAKRFAAEVVVTEPAVPDEAVTPADVTSLPDLSTMFAQVRQEAARPVVKRRARRRHQVLGAAAAAVVLAGGGVALVETVGSSSPSGPGTQRIALAPVGARHAPARATISAGTMHVDATALPKLDPSRQYEVWLSDSSGQHLRAVGYIGTDRTANLPVPRTVMSRYHAVAISIQKTDQVAFSGVMVARGFYG